MSELFRVPCENSFFSVSLWAFWSVSLPQLLLPSEAAAVLKSCHWLFLMMASRADLTLNMLWMTSNKDKICEWEFHNMPDRSNNDRSLGTGIFFFKMGIFMEPQTCSPVFSGCETAGFQTTTVLRLSVGELEVEIWHSQTLESLLFLSRFSHFS